MTSMTHYSRHAQARQQQRGIPGFVIESLNRFGWGDLLQLEGSSDHRWGVGEPYNHVRPHSALGYRPPVPQTQVPKLLQN
jgi:transposase InsO family protein